jgi:gamma-glutamylcyclotransferase (GGCT)/AIG2-like uncharacterized protein YtfP
VIEHLFVYGTLAPGRPNEHVLKDVPGSWLPATVRGDLVERGWGATMGFPALVLRADGPEVSGLVFASAELADQWAALDEFEGPGYDRVRTGARLESGELVDAWLYEAKRSDVGNDAR